MGNSLAAFSDSMLVEETVAEELQAKRLHALRRGRIITDDELAVDDEEEETGVIRLDPLYTPVTVRVAGRSITPRGSLCPLGLTLAIHTSRSDTHPGYETTVVA